jgi:SAM-dependent methyltransferase
MKIRDSGMPDEEVWERFFDAPLILSKLDFACEGEDVVDFGCGYGTFSLAAARLTSGTVHALDLEPDMIAVTAAKAQRSHLTNVRAVARDFVAVGSGLRSASVAYAMLFNVLHAEDAAGLLREACRVLRPNGVLAVIHWVHDDSTPRGPALSIRPRPEQVIAWALETGFVLQGSVISLPPHHYGLVARKPEADPQVSRVV